MRWIVILAVLLVGCTSEGPEFAADLDQAPRSTWINGERCEGVSLALGAPFDQLDPWLPAGYRPRALSDIMAEELGTANVEQETGLLAVDVWQCGVRHLSAIGIHIVPPVHDGIGPVPYNLYALGFASDDEALVATAQAHGLPAFSAALDILQRPFGIDRPQGDQHLVDFAWETSAGGTLQGAGAAFIDWHDSLRLRHWYQGDQPVVVDWTSPTHVSGGDGECQVAGDHPVAAFLETSQCPAERTWIASFSLANLYVDATILRGSPALGPDGGLNSPPAD